MNNLIDEIAARAAAENIDLNALSIEIRDLARNQKEEEIHTQVASHEDIVGKCFVEEGHQPRSGMFPPMRRYYYVVSPRAWSQFDVSVLHFDEYPTYWFGYKSTKIAYPGDWFLGEYDFHSLEVDQLPYAIIKTLPEISKQEFWYAAKSYINRLSCMEWPEDHYRHSNVLPGDPKWKEK